MHNMSKTKFFFRLNPPKNSNILMLYMIYYWKLTLGATWCRRALFVENSKKFSENYIIKEAKRLCCYLRGLKRYGTTGLRDCGTTELSESLKKF